MLAADGAGRALEHGGYAGRAVIELEQTGHGDAVFGLCLPRAAGCDSLHLLTLRCFQVLHFTFEYASN
jgi:hypothetical protein